MPLRLVRGPVAGSMRLIMQCGSMLSLWLCAPLQFSESRESARTCRSNKLFYNSVRSRQGPRNVAIRSIASFPAMNLKVRFTPDNRHPSMAFEAPDQPRSRGVLDHPLEPARARRRRDPVAGDHSAPVGQRHPAAKTRLSLPLLLKPRTLD